jgi:hypothetical protein
MRVKILNPSLGFSPQVQRASRGAVLDVSQDEAEQLVKDGAASVFVAEVGDDGTVDIEDIPHLQTQLRSKGPKAINAFLAMLRDISLSSVQESTGICWTYSSAGSPNDLTVRSSTGRVKGLRWDGVWSSVVGSGTPATSISFTGASWGTAPVSPYNVRTPKLVGIFPCDAGGVISGTITSFNGPSVAGVFDLSNAAALTILTLTSSASTEFDLTRSPNLTAAYISDNRRLVSVDVKGLAALHTLHLENSPSLEAVSTGGNTNLGNINCTNAVRLESLDLSSAQMVDSVTLNGCARLSSLKLGARLSPSFMLMATGIAVKEIDVSACPMFYSVTLNNCPNLEKLTLPRAIYDSEEKGSVHVNNAPKLAEIVTPAGSFQSVYANGCASLRSFRQAGPSFLGMLDVANTPVEAVELELVEYTYIELYNFQGCPNLRKLTLKLPVGVVGVADHTTVDIRNTPVLSGADARAFIDALPDATGSSSCSVLVNPKSGLGFALGTTPYRGWDINVLT